MYIAILDVIPYLAYVGAAVLLLVVGADLALARMRKPKPAKSADAKDSGRGLVGPAQPLGEDDSPADVHHEVSDSVVAEDDFPLPHAEPEPEPKPIPVPVLEADPEPEPEPDVPANLSATFEEDTNEVIYNKPSDTARSEAIEDHAQPENTDATADAPDSTNEKEQGEESDENMVYTDVLSMRRDPSVRVYDTAVAGSDRSPASS
jgi:hypothetical protein